MSDLPVLIILVAMALALVSFLLYVNLGSQGIPPRRIVVLLVELWLTFAVIIATFAYISNLLGPVPAGSIADELVMRLSRWRELSTVQQATILGGGVLVLVLFIHVIWSLRALQQRAGRNVPPSHGGTH